MQMGGLERRVMMHVDPNNPTHVDELPDDLGVFPVINSDLIHAGVPSSSVAGSAASASLPFSAVPAMESNPTAAAKLYLDFTGDTTSSWGSFRPGTTPAYDTDGDATTFSDSELASIQQVFSRVAEKFSPFNIDVTTVNPGNLTNRQTLKVVIGGDGAWLGAQAGGVSYVGSFADSSSNVVFVFPKMLANGVAQYVAEAAAHESGHAFGLQHQSSYDAKGNKTAEYAPANSNNDAPIMGGSYTARRGLWWDGTASDSIAHIQDDLTVISSSTNGFGYRADDFGGTITSASVLSLNGTSVSTQGVIEKTSDADVFSFTTGAGPVMFSADPVAGGMLDLKLELRDSAGTLLASQDNGLGESLSTNLAAGDFYLTISSHGSYGDVGQYSLHGEITEPTITPPLGAKNIPGDANLDGRVDFADLTIVSQNYGLVASAWQQGDFNGDGTVDFADLTEVAQNYGTQLPAETSATTKSSLSNSPALASAKRTVFSVKPISVRQNVIREPHWQRRV